MSSLDDSPEARIARWTARDAAIGAVAERDQLRQQLLNRDREIVDLRERLNHLSNSVGQLQYDKAKLVGLVERSAAKASIPRRIARRLRTRLLRP